MTKVLLVDDDNNMLSLLRTLLEIEGYQVVSFNDVDPNKLIGLMEQERPDVMLIDVHIHQINGLDLLHRLRNDSQYQGTRIIMTSGMDFQDPSMEEGADAFLMKPYMPDDLIKLIRHQIEQV
jgi:DNA-binding response OmpR family regulator